MARVEDVVPGQAEKRIRAIFVEDAVVELTAVTAWENSSSKFTRALRVPCQELWRWGELRG